MNQQFTIIIAKINICKKAKRTSNVWLVTKILGGYNEKTEKTSPEECMYFSTPMKIYRNEVALMAQANCQPKISAPRSIHILMWHYNFTVPQGHLILQSENSLKASMDLWLMAQPQSRAIPNCNTDVMRGFFELSKINNGILNVVLLLDPLKITPI